MDQIISYNKTN